MPTSTPFQELEGDRQRALDELDLLDTPSEAEFDELVALASDICSAPMSLVSLVDRDRQWFKAKVGLEVTETPRVHSFCSRAIEQDGIFVVEDATEDDRFSENPYVLGQPHIRFYAGVPLLAPGDQPIGTLCVIDTMPRHLSGRERHALGILARQVQARIELRAKQRNLEKALALNEDLNAVLLRSNDELEHLFDSVGAVLIGLDSAGHITHWNVAATFTFGLSLRQVRGKDLTACGIHWLEPAALRDQLRRVTNLDRRGDFQFESSGQNKWLDVTISRVEKLGSQGRSGFLLSASDITDRLALEQEVRQVHKLEAIGQLAAGIAHEINTPTQYIGDNLSFLQDSWAGVAKVLDISKEMRQQIERQSPGVESIHEFDRAMEASDLAFVLGEVPKALEQSRDGVQAISRIVTAMKEFSHPGSQAKTVLDLNRAVENTVALGKGEWRYVADVVTHCDPAIPTITCHPGEIIQVILNLLVNAAHAIADKAGDTPEPTRGTITIVTRQQNQHVELTISDTGTGIPEALRERIFEPFFTTKEVGRGTGQGLSFAHAVIVKKHEGKLWVESEMGIGSTFGIRLPIGTPGRE